MKENVEDVRPIGRRKFDGLLCRGMENVALFE
jgi:hypothetical protein